MDKRIDASVLLSFYGAMLTDRQRELLRYHYDEDLSLSEIAALCGVTRQGAHDAIRRGEKQLIALESQLGLRASWERTRQALCACRDAIAGNNTEAALSIIDTLLRQEEEQNGV